MNPLLIFAPCYSSLNISTVLLWVRTLRTDPSVIFVFFFGRSAALASCEEVANGCFLTIGEVVLTVIA